MSPRSRGIMPDGLLPEQRRLICLAPRQFQPVGRFRNAQSSDATARLVCAVWLEVRRIEEAAFADELVLWSRCLSPAVPPNGDVGHPDGGVPGSEGRSARRMPEQLARFNRGSVDPPGVGRSPFGFLRGRCSGLGCPALCKGAGQRDSRWRGPVRFRTRRECLRFPAVYVFSITATAAHARVR